jgi:hypothetical protein
MMFLSFKNNTAVSLVEKERLAFPEHIISPQILFEFMLPNVNLLCSVL